MTPTPASGGALPLAAPSAFAELQAQVDRNLHGDILEKWFPRAIDERQGGFAQEFGSDWSPLQSPRRSIVYQARLTWTAATASERYPARKADYLRIAAHGLAVLESRMWDQENGGFLWCVDANGAPDNRDGSIKHAYGIAFGIYACSEVYRATRDGRALDLARRAYFWLDSHAHDAKHGGYFEALAKNGSPILTPPHDKPKDQIGTAYGGKSMNAHIHLLEAFTALYEVWPNDRLRSRLQEVFEIVRDRVAAPEGYLNLWFAPDWSPVSHEDSYGHDIETAYLLVETCAALGVPDDPQTWTVARRLVDHTLDYGWDTEHGGFFDEGPANGEAAKRDKIWWTQAEGLNALLLMHERYGGSTPKYREAFLRQWEFIRDYQVDRQYGGWYPAVSENGTPRPNRNKSNSWTDPYHQGRALMNVSARLQALAERHS